MTGTGYSINILPAGEEYNRFETLIIELAEECGAPLFAPHVTVLGQASLDEDSALELMEKLVSNQQPFTLTLNKVDYRDYFFRALYVLAEKTEPLVELHEKAKQIFGKKNVAEYMPHLSLLYGDFKPELKKKIIKEIGKEQPAVFEVNSLHLFRTEGEADEWYPVAEFPFPTPTSEVETY